MNILEAVNILLDGIGEDNVNSLDTGYTEATQAQKTINRVSRDVQADGWWFNRDLNVRLVADAFDNVPLPANVLSAQFLARTRYTQRGLRVYDRENHTFNITAPVYCNLIVELHFDELPASAQKYVIARAARIYQDQILGSGTLHEFQGRDEMEAKVAFLEDEALNAQYNIYNNFDYTLMLDRNPR